MQRKTILRIFIILSAVIVLAGALTAYLLWRAVYKNNVALDGEAVKSVYVSTGSNYNDLLKTIEEAGVLKNINTFKWVAGRKNLPAHVYPGRYIFRAGMNNDEIADMLRSGAQTPVNVIFNNIRTIDQLAGIVGRQIEADSANISGMLKSPEYLEEKGLSREMVPSVFIPNTYEFYWNTSAAAFIERMHLEYERFWTPERKEQAKAQKLSPAQVSILASIVDMETNKGDEKNRIAGVYLNRLRKGWKLQADPTVVYAFYLENDSILRRVYRKHTRIDSPYNTYKYRGLPPGPISIPSIEGLEAVLKPEDHDYMFFVVRADGSGYHHFSETYRQHLRYAREHYKALNNRE